MSDFKAEMHQIQFWAPAVGAYSAPPDTLAGLRGPTSKGREEMGGKRRGRERGERGERRDRWEGCPKFAFEIYGHLRYIDKAQQCKKFFFLQTGIVLTRHLTF